MKEIPIRTHERNTLLDITHHVAQIVDRSGVIDGICTVYCPHTTGAITINENADPDVVSDMIMKLNKMVPHHEGYAHMEDNSDAHIKSSMIGNSVQVIISAGQLKLGTWQGIYFCEFDGPRTRKVWVMVN